MRNEKTETTSLFALHLFFSAKTQHSTLLLLHTDKTRRNYPSSSSENRHSPNIANLHAASCPSLALMVSLRWYTVWVLSGGLPVCLLVVWMVNPSPFSFLFPPRRTSLPICTAHSPNISPPNHKYLLYFPFLLSSFGRHLQIAEQSITQKIPVEELEDKDGEASPLLIPQWCFPPHTHMFISQSRPLSFSLP